MSSDDRHYRQYGQAAGHPADPDRSLLIAGWVCAILLAPIGFVIGIILLTRGRLGHGLAMMIVALLLTVSLASAVGGSSDPSYQIEISTPTN